MKDSETSSDTAKGGITTGDRRPAGGAEDETPIVDAIQLSDFIESHHRYADSGYPELEGQWIYHHLEWTLICMALRAFKQPTSVPEAPPDRDSPKPPDAMP